jgi:hypothetical protein
VGGEGVGDRQGSRLITQATTNITIGILEDWNIGMMGKGKNSFFILSIFHYSNIPSFHRLNRGLYQWIRC